VKGISLGSALFFGKATGDMLERKFIGTACKGSREINYEIENGLEKIIKNERGDQLE
jgi:hypothetical protein